MSNLSPNGQLLGNLEHTAAEWVIVSVLSKIAVEMTQE